MFKSRLMTGFVVFLFAFPPAYGAFEYMQLVLTWPISFCHTKKCVRIPTNFTIHGLWPDNKNTLLNNCAPGATYHMIDDPGMLKQMDDRWTELTSDVKNSKEYQGFWQHEFLKHGTCCEGHNTEEAYFKLAMRLKDRFDLLTILRASGIIPGNYYSIDSIQKAIKGVTRAVPNLYCNPDPHNPRMELVEIGICFDPKATYVMVCRRYKTCHRDGNTLIYFPG
ncbi:ribonuclease S-7-like [Lycium ferocissimum]|nr:ribonuclease S-7-like [Lycium ferocissimum]